MKLNIGCYTVMAKGWLNIDMLPLHQHAKENGFDFVWMDVRYGIPAAPESVDLIAASHFLEHLNYQQGFNFLNACRRVLKPGGVVRIGVPDLELLAAKYMNRTLGELDSINEPCKQTTFQAGKFWHLLFDGHAAAYDFEALHAAAIAAGFSSCERREAGKGHPIITAETKDMYPELSLYVEMTV